MSEMTTALPTVKGTSGLDVEAAVKHLNDNALANSSGRCARYVRQALEAGKVINSSYPVHAKDYGPTLTGKGFVQIPASAQTPYEPQKGDIAVIQPYEGGSISGHICMYNGAQWVSDFKQRDMWGGPGYRSAMPAYAIYRP